MAWASAIDPIGSNDWFDLLEHIRSIHAVDNPASHVQYLALANPKDTYAEFCGGGCFKGKAYINSNILLLEPEWQTAVAIGYDTHYDTALHEVAHSLGLNHTSECNAMSLPGWDERTQTLLPIATHSDLMTPCKNRWVSADITPKLHQRLIELQTFTTIDAPSRPHRILSIRADSSTSWGTERLLVEAPPGVDGVVSVLALDALGAVLEVVHARRIDTGDYKERVLLIPVVVGAHFIQLPSGQRVETR